MTNDEYDDSANGWEECLLGTPPSLPQKALICIVEGVLSEQTLDVSTLVSADQQQPNRNVGNLQRPTITSVTTPQETIKMSGRGRRGHGRGGCGGGNRDILLEIAPTHVYCPFVTVNKKGEKQPILQCCNTIHGTMIASLLWYRKFTGELIADGYEGFTIVSSMKQKLNTRSSTESEVIGINNFMLSICWAHYFMIAQGYPVQDNVLYQDNRSAMLLAKNGRASSTKRTKHINIRCFFVTDKIVAKKEVTVEWCPTGDMVGDYMMKPLQGAMFRKFRDLIMGIKKPNPKTNCNCLAPP